MTRPLPFTAGTIGARYIEKRAHRTLLEAGISADSLRDDSKPLAPIISERQFAFFLVVIAAVVVALIAVGVIK